MTNLENQALTFGMVFISVSIPQDKILPIGPTTVYEIYNVIILFIQQEADVVQCC